MDHARRHTLRSLKAAVLPFRDLRGSNHDKNLQENVCIAKEVETTHTREAIKFLNIS